MKISQTAVRFCALPQNGLGSHLGCLRHQLHIVDEEAAKVMGLDTINNMYCATLVVRYGENFLRLVLYVQVWVTLNITFEHLPSRAPKPEETHMNRLFMELVFCDTVEQDPTKSYMLEQIKQSSRQPSNAKA